MFRKIIGILILIVLTTGCYKENESMSTASTTPPSTNSSSVSNAIVEPTSTESMLNPYFFPADIMEKEYILLDEGNYENGYRDCTLKINLLGDIDKGKLYSVWIDGTTLKEHSYISGHERSDLGCFYVTSDTIIHMTTFEGQKLLSSAKLGDSVRLPNDAMIVYQKGETSNEDFYRYEWTYGHIDDERDIYEFNNFENSEEPYKYITWKKDKGMIYYSNGWGGKDYGIFLIAKDSKIYETIKGYEHSLIDAINNGNFDLVSPYLIPDSSLYNSQKNLVSNLYNKGIQERLNTFSIYKISIDEDNVVTIGVNESIGIKYSGESEFTNKNYRWEYSMINTGEKIGLSNIEKPY